MVQAWRHFYFTPPINQVWTKVPLPWKVLTPPPRPPHWNHLLPWKVPPPTQKVPPPWRMAAAKWIYNLDLPGLCGQMFCVCGGGCPSMVTLIPWIRGSMTSDGLEAEKQDPNTGDRFLHLFRFRVPSARRLLKFCPNVSVTLYITAKWRPMGHIVRTILRPFKQK